MRDATLEYRLSIYHARASDSGLYTCNTPNNKSHSIHIIVADVRLVNVLFWCCHKLFELFNYQNSWDQIVVFNICM